MTAGAGEQYDPAEVESRWQRIWDEQGVFRTEDTVEDPTYVLGMFPYPSGEMHMGHVSNYTITDTYARYQRMQGNEVLHPMGWDAFGLPAENAANERGVDPREWTMDCIQNIKAQMELMGLGFDWDREITTCNCEYYRWNQWFFMKFYEEGLIERQSAKLNWCPGCETVLANEQVESDERCWRCGTSIEHREFDQWFCTITDYTEELYDSLEELDGWPDNVREMQRNWIGRQEGDAVEFELTTGDSVEIFTTRLDTLYGATFVALSPGHDVAHEIARQNEVVADYIHRVEHTEIDATTGVHTGEYATNPATGKDIPVYVADYVVADVGTGALYAVPAHDERDHAFANAHGIPIKQVIEPPTDADVDPEAVAVGEQAYTEDGVLINSGEYDDLTSAEARERFVGVFDGEHRVEHSLQDWCISRQRYWGTPIPFVNCPDCGYVPVPEEELPVELPAFIQTTGNPLDAAEEWKQVVCPDCGGRAERETDTMDTFVDSSWYYLRYVAPDLETAPFDADRASDWLPVDQYVGGIEHATMHLIYSRFFTKVLADMELLQGSREPFERLLTQGMVRKDGTAMSSSTGNVVSPRPFVERFGADTARLFMMNAAQPEKDFDWTEEGARSAHQFLQNVYRLTTEAVNKIEKAADSAVADYVTREIETTIVTASEEFESFRFNHALQAVRELVSLLWRYHEHPNTDSAVFEQGVVTVTKLLAPIAPHIAEEIWEQLEKDGLIADTDWPAADLPEGYEIERRLVSNTRDDVREIVAIARIDNPTQITIAVAPAWKHEIYERAHNHDTDDFIGEVMENERFRQHGGVAASFTKELGQRNALAETVDADRERATLERASWLIEREFDAAVTVLSGADADEELMKQATPGRPAIRIE